MQGFRKPNVIFSLLLIFLSQDLFASNDRGSVSAIPCHAIHNSVFITQPKEGGLGPDGDTQTPWELNFKAENKDAANEGIVIWAHGDVLEKGRYECDSTVLYITIADHIQDVPFTDSIVYFQNDEYKKYVKKQQKSSQNSQKD